MRRLLVMIALLLAFSPVAVIAQDAASDEAVERTNVRLLLPFGPDGLNGDLAEVAAVNGNCAIDSLHVPARGEAWECIGDDDTVYDPCFENPYGAADAPGVLACVESPFSTDVVMLALDEPLVRDKESPADAIHDPWNLPWALELANGEQCVLLSDIELVLAGLSVYYNCSQGGSVLGDLNRGGDVWTVSYAAPDAIGSSLVDVVTAWS